MTLSYTKTVVKIRSLVWDEWNIEHIKKHKVTKNEVEEAAKNIKVSEQTKQGRYLVIGRAGSRILTLILSRKGLGIYYLVTARDAAKKERSRVYEKEKKEIT